MDPEDFSDWLEKQAEEFAQCDASCDFSRLIESIKQEVSRWVSGVQPDGSI
jgi:hypothetical protein